MKVVAIVRFNDGEGFVLDEKPILKYTKYGIDTIIGIDDSKTFISCYGYEYQTENWKAFAGRKFDIELTDGTVEHCTGQWWDKVTDRAKAELKNIMPKNDIFWYHQTAKDIESLKDCYVFAGYSASKINFQKLRSECEDQKVYGYWELIFCVLFLAF